MLIKLIIIFAQIFFNNIFCSQKKYSRTDSVETINKVNILLEHEKQRIHDILNSTILEDDSNEQLQKQFHSKRLKIRQDNNLYRQILEHWDKSNKNSQNGRKNSVILDPLKLKKICKDSNHTIFHTPILQWASNLNIIKELGEKLCYCNIFNNYQEINWDSLWDSILSQKSVDLVKEQCKNYIINCYENSSLPCCSGRQLLDEIDKFLEDWDNLSKEEVLLIHMLIVNSNNNIITIKKKGYGQQIAALRNLCENEDHQIFKNIVSLYIKVQKLDNPRTNINESELCICKLLK